MHIDNLTFELFDEAVHPIRRFFFCLSPVFVHDFDLFGILQLGKHKEALDYAMAANHIDPSNSEARERIQKIRGNLAAGTQEMHLVCFMLGKHKVTFDFRRAKCHADSFVSEAVGCSQSI